MDYKKLVEKYWAGETSLGEEKLLKQYFNGEQIAEDLKPFQATFKYFSKQQKIVAPTTIITNSPNKTAKIVSLNESWNTQFLFRIAASILFLLAVGFWYQSKTELPKEQRMANYWESKEIKDPKLAYLKTKAALLLVSNKLNKGREVAINQVIKVRQAGKFVKLK